MTRTSSTPNITPSSSSQPTPATTASSSASSSSSSSSYRLLSFVNDLRTRSEQAIKKKQDAAAANESLAVALQNENKEARRLANEIESTVKITRDARKQVIHLPIHSSIHPLIHPYTLVYTHRWTLSTTACWCVR